VHGARRSLTIICNRVSDKNSKEKLYTRIIVLYPRSCNINVTCHQSQKYNTRSRYILLLFIRVIKANVEILLQQCIIVTALQYTAYNIIYRDTGIV